MLWAEKIKSDLLRGSWRGESKNTFCPLLILRMKFILLESVTNTDKLLIGKIENKICDPAKLPSPVGFKSIWPFDIWCLSWLNPGIPHHNLCEKYRRENLRKLLSYDTTFQEILASDVIIEKMADSPKENTSISLLTMGTPYKIIKPSTYDSKASTSTKLDFIQVMDY